LSAKPPALRPSNYEAHQKVYPRDVAGRFARLRRIAVFVLLGLYYVLPWLDFGGRQAVLFNLSERKFYIFSLVLWPQDFIFLTWLLVIAALTLFFVTALAGRLWCGYACPQTVWTEVYLWQERLAEGNRAARIRLDQAPWTPSKFARKGAKQFMWIVTGLWTGFTFVGFFTPVRELWTEVATLSVGPWEAFWCLFYGFATYGNAGLLREQVCKYICPYARIQGAMFDRHTLIITYDGARGEPRGARRRPAAPDATPAGDCVDCTWCVQVCPTGIDIRAGLQNECIACAACIDACDIVMDRVGAPRGLIRYTTEHALEHQSAVILRPRIIVYACALVLLVVGFAAALALRKPVGLDVLRDRTSLYRLLDDGGVENVYVLKIANKTERAHSYAVAAAGAGSLTLDPQQHYLVPAGEVVPVVLRVRRPAADARRSGTIQFRIAADDDQRLAATAPARFIGAPP